MSIISVKKLKPELVASAYTFGIFGEKLRKGKERKMEKPNKAKRINA